jgi:hypothetical protein
MLQRGFQPRLCDVTAVEDSCLQMFSTPEVQHFSTCLLLHLFEAFAADCKTLGGTHCTLALMAPG